MNVSPHLTVDYLLKKESRIRLCYSFNVTMELFVAYPIEPIFGSFSYFQNHFPPHEL